MNKKMPKQDRTMIIHSYEQICTRALRIIAIGSFDCRSFEVQVDGFKRRILIDDLINFAISMRRFIHISQHLESVMAIKIENEIFRVQEKTFEISFISLEKPVPIWNIINTIIHSEEISVALNGGELIKHFNAVDFKKLMAEDRNPIVLGEAKNFVPRLICASDHNNIMVKLDEFIHISMNLVVQPIVEQMADAGVFLEFLQDDMS